MHFCAVLSQRLSQMDRQYSQGRDAFNSLAEEFYNKRPADEQRFYRHAALLTTLKPRIVSTLLHSEKAAAFLADLENSQLPLIRRVDGGYESHGFFREFLAEKLLDVEGVTKQQQLHSEFAALYEEQNNWEQATHHALEAKDWVGVGRMIVAHKDDLLKNSPGFVKGAGARIPPDVFYADPALVHVQADALCILGDTAGAVRCFKKALAQKESTLGAATLARYDEAADRMIARKDFTQALTYLRSAFDVAAQQAPIHALSKATSTDCMVNRRSPVLMH